MPSAEAARPPAAGAPVEGLQLAQEGVEIDAGAAQLLAAQVQGVDLLPAEEGLAVHRRADQRQHVAGHGEPLGRGGGLQLDLLFGRQADLEPGCLHARSPTWVHLSSGPKGVAKLPAPAPHPAAIWAGLAGGPPGGRPGILYGQNAYPAPQRTGVFDFADSGDNKGLTESGLEKPVPRGQRGPHNSVSPSHKTGATAEKPGVTAEKPGVTRIPKIKNPVPRLRGPFERALKKPGGTRARKGPKLGGTPSKTPGHPLENPGAPPGKPGGTPAKTPGHG